MGPLGYFDLGVSGPSPCIDCDKCQREKKDGHILWGEEGKRHRIWVSKDVVKIDERKTEKGVDNWGGVWYIN